MNCREFTSIAAAWLDGELPEADAGAAREHLARCGDCSRLVEDLEQIRIIQKAKKLKRAGKSIRDIAKEANLALGYVHKILNVNLRSVKASYGNGL